MQLDVNGLAVFKYGNPSNLPIILLHGFPYSSNMWRNQVEELQKQYYCIAFDLRGLGKSSAGDGQFTIEGFVDDLFTVMDQLQIEKPVIVGFSMGGYITLRAVERDPNRFRGVVLCDTKSSADDDAGKIKRAELIKTINVEGMESFANNFVPITFTKDAAEKIPDVYYSALQEARQQNPLGVKGCLLAMAARTDTTRLLETIKVPVLLIVGGQDTLTSFSVMKDMQDKILDSEIKVVGGVGHMAPLEKPDIVTRYIQDFISQF